MHNKPHDVRYVARDRTWHPQAYTPAYKSSIPRSPRQALVSLQHQTASERSGPDFSRLPLGPHDNDLLLNFGTGQLPQGERIILFGTLRDQFGRENVFLNYR